MARFYEPDLGAEPDSPFARDALNKLVRRSYWLDMNDRTLVMGDGQWGRCASNKRRKESASDRFEARASDRSGMCSGNFAAIKIDPSASSVHRRSATRDSQDVDHRQYRSHPVKVGHFPYSMPLSELASNIFFTLCSLEVLSHFQSHAGTAYPRAASGAPPQFDQGPSLNPLVSAGEKPHEHSGSPL